jgi:hypothetical protein
VCGSLVWRPVPSLIVWAVRFAAAASNAFFSTGTLTLYGKKVEFWHQTIDALWYAKPRQQLTGPVGGVMSFDMVVTASVIEVAEIYRTTSGPERGAVDFRRVGSV